MSEFQIKDQSLKYIFQQNNIDQNELESHINEYANNKVDIGRIIDFSHGNIKGPIPIYSP
jgi:hypothetical protein